MLESGQTLLHLYDHARARPCGSPFSPGSVEPRRLHPQNGYQGRSAFELLVTLS